MALRVLMRPVCQHEMHLKRGYSTKKLTNSQVRKKRNDLFGQEKARQLSLVSRIEKIKVEHRGPPEECSLLMNKNLSTPFNCAMHISELLMDRSVVALVNGEPWDMHRPLEEDCEVKFLHFKDEDPSLSNQTFWRSCSFMLGHVLETAFKDEHYVELCSFPAPNVKSGSFVYDAFLDVEDWNPTSEELNIMSRIGGQLGHLNQKFERLEVDASLAQTMFEDNRFKSQQVPLIAASGRHGHTVTLYRIGDHVDMSRGPLMSTTGLISRFAISTIHNIESPDLGPLQRIQGMALPRQLPAHYWTYELLCKRAKQLNPAPVPTLKQGEAVSVAENHTQ